MGEREAEIRLFWISAMGIRAKVLARVPYVELKADLDELECIGMFSEDAQLRLRCWGLMAEAARFYTRELIEAGACASSA